MCAARGLIRLLIFYGVDPHDFLVRRAVLNLAREAAGRYRGFREDILDAVYWKRWLDKQSIGGLPPEIGHMIMMKSWEKWCLWGN
jgi:hypothetical protein